MAPVPPIGPGRRCAGALLALLLVWAFGLRVWAAGFDLTVERFWDERYGLENVAALLDGSWRPASGYHPSLSYLPQAALLAGCEGLWRATGAEVLRVRRPDGTFTPTAYFLSRFLQAAFGAWSLFLLFLVGRRVFSDRVGLAAALLLAVVPWHVRQSVIFKPDILLVALVLLSFLWTLDAVERPSARRYLRAGAGVGLALAGKLNAGPIALPLAAVALWEGRRDRRLWLWLALAGAAAVVVFLLLNPTVVLDPDLYRRNVGRTLRDYARKGAAVQATHWGVFAAGVLALVSPAFHGAVVGAVAFAGLIGLAVLAVRSRGPAAQRRGAALVLVYVGGYALLYSLSTTNPSPHNWLPLCPFLALAAGWLAVWGWDRVTGGLAPGPRRVAGGVAAGVATLVLAVPVTASTWRSEATTTVDLAQLYLRERLEAPYSRRVVCTEPLGRRLVVKSGRDKAGVLVVPWLEEMAAVDLDRCDAVVYRAGESAREIGQGQRGRIAPRWLRVRGAGFRWWCSLGA